MAIKMLVPMTTLVTNNEQSASSPITVTSTGTSREYGELGRFSRGTFLLDVTATAGTLPTLDVIIQGFDELANKWRTVVTFAQVTGAQVPVTPAAQSTTLDFKVYRTQWTVGGTGGPSFTFTLGCIAHTEEALPQ
jgi:hypothetical protein